jgi:hypothetical protein
VATFEVIKAVSEGLRDHLNDRLAESALVPAPEARLHSLQTPPPTNPPLLTVFLYDVCEEASLRNRPRSVAVAPDGTVRAVPAPLPIVLRYMLTPWAVEPADAHVMLGCALRALWGSSLLRRFAETPNEAEVVSVNLVQLSVEEKAKIWWAIQQPYQVSLNYDVRVVDIDSPDRTRREAVVETRVFDTGVPAGAGA